MDHMGIGPDFWLKFLGLIGGLVLLIYCFNTIMRKVLNVERRKFFAGNDHINSVHRKGDWIIRGISVAVIIVIAILGIGHMPHQSYSLVLFIASVLLAALGEVFRAVMEWKYKKESNDYLFTISQLVFLLAVTYFALESGGFGLFAF
ncbi:DUF4181 domain-containing protein [Lentibacillus sp. CBA3610]|uniref:DUF4181 domain-containing protein n=1 Tax=Lentibacillus sp. CBA3610 TaxID=2518176 RepID=UPI001595C516|nr:DUF4181 domain-containing protein [Lentibacillus sp. CBA3610]QKY70727.1 DUF4181 domain-containing protein [Lentibacillus sp. CBA3610]